MKQNGEKRPLTPKQKQAVIVCAVCALALILTASITGVLVSKAVRSQSESEIAASEGYVGTDYVIDSAAVLTETEDAGDSYVSDTLFIGDSNTVRMNKNGLISLQNFCAEEGLGIEDAAKKEIVAFKNDSKMYSIPDAVAMMKPRRVLITLGTNDASSTMGTENFISAYKTLISAIQSSYSYTDIIVNAVPPVPAAHSKYPDVSQTTIDDYNMALAELCEEMNCKFLNSAEALKDETGYGVSTYYGENDVHMTLSGLKAMLEYYRTHAYESEDRRPAEDQKATVPQRVQTSAASGSGSASSEAPTPTPSASAEVKYTASYFVEASGGGTLTSGQDSGKTSLKYEITADTKSITVTAVPSTGYIFSKWSDGETSATRTDSNFTKNINVTAIFTSVSLAVTASSSEVDPGTSVSCNATLTVGTGGGNANSIYWYYKDAGGVANGAGTGASYTFTQSTPGTYTVYAVYQVGGKEVAISNMVKITVKTPPTATPAPTTPPPTATPSPTPTATPEPTPTATPEVTPDPSSTLQTEQAQS